jgi:topoisomerase-4 subunit A
MAKLQKIETAEFSNILGEKYLEYALSTIMSRSLPDVRDGLKPVHRRLIYAMHQLRLNPDSAYKKCARIVGDVIGKYHPHGDIAVYDTLVRLAQNFSLRYPLIDGQGNFGSIDGDNAAAMRYTESRMTEFSMLLVDGLDQDTVDFRANYDGSEEEPALLPASFPNLLANGSEGIAVGMATNIPPHNLSELSDAMIHMLDHPEFQISDLMQYIKGPDFPTGGIIIDSEDMIRSAYQNGRGLVRIRAKWEKQALSHGLYQILITEIPYQVQKSKLIENIANLMKEKKLPFLDNIRDESTEDVRIILEPKNRSCDAEALMNSLFKLTDLETRFHLNFNVLDKDLRPRVMNIAELLQSFLDHRFVVVTRRSEFRLAKIKHRLEILEGLKIAYLNLDEVIQIIREEDEPKQRLMERFLLTEIQAEAILNLRLRSLRKLEQLEINQEITDLTKEQKYLGKVVSDRTECLRVIRSEIIEIKEKFASEHPLGPRKTALMEVEHSNNVISIEAFIEREPITVFCSEKGWIKSLKGHLSGDDMNIKYKEGDDAKFILHCYTTDKILIFTSMGRFYTILADDICKSKGFGEPIRLMIELAQENEIISMFMFKSEDRLLLAALNGKGFIVEASEALSQTKLGKQIFNVTEKSKAILCLKVTGDHFAIIGSNRKLLVATVAEIPVMKKGQGVRLQKYSQANLEDIKIFNAADGLSWKLGDRVRTEADIQPWVGKCGFIGKLPPVGFPKNNKFSG